MDHKMDEYGGHGLQHKKKTTEEKYVSMLLLLQHFFPQKIHRRGACMLQVRDHTTQLPLFTLLCVGYIRETVTVATLVLTPNAISNEDGLLRPPDATGTAWRHVVFFFLFFYGVRGYWMNSFHPCNMDEKRSSNPEKRVISNKWVKYHFRWAITY